MTTIATFNVHDVNTHPPQTARRHPIWHRLLAAAQFIRREIPRRCHRASRLRSPLARSEVLPRSGNSHAGRSANGARARLAPRSSRHTQSLHRGPDRRVGDWLPPLAERQSCPRPEFDYKLAWFRRLISYAQTLLKEDTVVCGDHKVVPTAIDTVGPARRRGCRLLPADPSGLCR